ncbi:MAG TPA: hypothetical protein DCQ28_01210 [Bacteroidetes bacterium]|nr:hypothetical protein [Bacteroidota bacterium]
MRSHKDGGGTELVLHQMMYYEDTTTNARVYGLGSGALSNALYPYEGNDRWKIQQMVVNIMSHFSEKKYIGNVYTPISNPLEWSSNISLDGYVRILPNKKLLITGSPTVTIDSILLIDGELEINGNVTVAGAGSLNINPTGKLRLKENSTFTINPATFIMEAGSSIIYESGAKLVVKNATIKNNATLTVSSGGELDISSGGTLRFGSNSNVYSYGKVLATNATFTSLSGNSAGSWGNIKFENVTLMGTNLNYCKIEKGGEVQCINGADVFVQNSVFRKMNRAVYFNNSAPWILGNDIDSMSLHAIEGTTNYQETSVYWNTIKRGYASQNYAGILFKSTGGNIIENKIEGFNVGMFFNGGSSPDFNQGNDNNPNPNNKITNNYTGVEVAYGSNPNMGDAEDYVNGNNSI